MMGEKYLHELLKEEQEPFLLNKYISDRRRQIIKSQHHQQHQHQHQHQNPSNTFPLNLCKNAASIFSFRDTQPHNLTKSPLFELASPVTKSTRKSPNNTIFLHIPSRTAALLLEAALRIQKHSKSKNNNGFGLLGSLFKRLTNRKKEIQGVSFVNKDISNNVVGFGGSSYNYNGRSSSAVWSEDKSLDMDMDMDMDMDVDMDMDMETSSSTSTSSNHSQDIVDLLASQIKHHSSDFCETPFRFVLQRTPSSSSSSARNTPDLPSPTRQTTQDKESNGAESLNKLQTGEEEEEEEEDKEQCSPVSVLDPPFEDDDEGHRNDDDVEMEGEDGFDLECSYAIMQRAKQQLFYKLRRFEKLAGLDPVELEKTMLDEEGDEDETLFMEEDDYDDDASCEEKNNLRELVFEALRQSSFDHDRVQIPEGLKKLVSDLIVEEERELNCLEDKEKVVRRVCKRLDLWTQVESNTIDMMIEDDFSREDVGWKKNGEQVRDMAGELDLAIFGFLVGEFSEELEC